MRLPAMRTTISSRCHRSLGRGRERRSLRANPGPNFIQNPPPHRFIGNLQASLGQKLLHVAVAQGEPEIKPDRVLDDRRREPMSAIGSLIHAEAYHRLPAPTACL